MPQVDMRVRHKDLQGLVSPDSKEAGEIEERIFSVMTELGFLREPNMSEALAFDWSAFRRSRAASDLAMYVDYSFPSGLVAPEAGDQKYVKGFAAALHKELKDYVSARWSAVKNIGVWLKPQLNAGWVDG